MASKRERATNWEKEEKQILREVMKPYVHIVENKDLSTNTNKAKLKAWSEIAEKFNIINSKTRDKKQIVNKWKITKLNSKKEMSKYRQDISKTGGGPRPPSPSPETLELVELLPQEFEVDSNEFNCDGVKEKEDIKENTGIEPTIDPKDIIIVEEFNYENIDKDIEAFVPQCEPPAPASSFTPKRPVKKTSSSKNKSDFNFGEASYDDMHQFRVLENERLQREHELRMKHMQELQAQVLVNLKLQEEILKKQLSSLNKKF